MADIMKELEAIEEIAKSPEFAWEGEEDILSYAEDLFYNEDELYFGEEGAKSPSGTTYGLRCANSTTSSVIIKLFGYEGERYYNEETGDSITIVAHSGYGSYPYFLDFTKSNPAEVVGLRVQSTEAQINQMAYKFVDANVWGHRKENVVSLSTYRTEKDYLTGTITVPITHKLDIMSYVEFTLLPTTTIDLIFFIGLRREASKPIEIRPSRPALAGKAGRIFTAPRRKIIRRVK